MWRKAVRCIQPGEYRQQRLLQQLLPALLVQDGCIRQPAHKIAGDAPHAYQQQHGQHKAREGAYHLAKGGVRFLGCAPLCPGRSGLDGAGEGGREGREELAARTCQTGGSQSSGRGEQQLATTIQGGCEAPSEVVTGWRLTWAAGGGVPLGPPDAPGCSAAQHMGREGALAAAGSGERGMWRQTEGRLRK